LRRVSIGIQTGHNSSLLGFIKTNPKTVETVAFALGVLVVTYTVQDGKSNYLEGAMVCLHSVPRRNHLLTTAQLLGLYVIIALAFWASPTDALGKALALLPGQ
jgi:Ca2+:H+ antiporter